MHLRPFTLHPRAFPSLRRAGPCRRSSPHRRRALVVVDHTIGGEASQCPGPNDAPFQGCARFATRLDRLHRRSSTTKPSIPWRTISGNAPTRRAMSGVPVASDSATTSPNGSGHSPSMIVASASPKSPSRAGGPTSPRNVTMPCALGRFDDSAGRSRSRRASAPWRRPSAASPYGAPARWRRRGPSRG